MYDPRVKLSVDVGPPRELEISEGAPCKASIYQIVGPFVGKPGVENFW